MGLGIAVAEIHFHAVVSPPAHIIMMDIDAAVRRGIETRHAQGITEAGNSVIGDFYILPANDDAFIIPGVPRGIAKNVVSFQEVVDNIEVTMAAGSAVGLGDDAQIDIFYMIAADDVADSAVAVCPVSYLDAFFCILHQ